MTIERGRPWGQPARWDEGAPFAGDDASLASLVEEGRTDVPIALLGGDLHRTLGSPAPERLRSDAAMAFPIDALEVHLDDEPPFVAVAHVVARAGAWWRRPTVVAMNAAFHGDLNLGPRAHPNDGLVDVTVGRLPLREAVAARPRMLSGSHLPHPALDTTRAQHWEVELRRPTPIFADGVRRGHARRITIDVLADHFRIVC